MLNSILTKKSLCVAVAGLAFSGLCGRALAADRSDTSVRVVSTSGVDFRNPAAVGAFYSQLRMAADAVCGGYSSYDRATLADVACADKALADAVRSANQPPLTAMYDRKQPRSAFAALN